MLLSRKWWESAKNASYGFYRFWSLLLNCIISKVVSLVVDPLFQGQLFKMPKHLGNGKSWRKKVEYDFCRIWYLPSYETIVKFVLCDMHPHFEGQNCKQSLSRSSRCTSTSPFIELLLSETRHAICGLLGPLHTHTHTHTATVCKCQSITFIFKVCTCNHK